MVPTTIYTSDVLRRLRELGDALTDEQKSDGQQWMKIERIMREEGFKGVKQIVLRQYYGQLVDGTHRSFAKEAGQSSEKAKEKLERVRATNQERAANFKSDRVNFTWSEQDRDDLTDIVAANPTATWEQRTKLFKQMKPKEREVLTKGKVQSQFAAMVVPPTEYKKTMAVAYQARKRANETPLERQSYNLGGHSGSREVLERGAKRLRVEVDEEEQDAEEDEEDDEE
ncbi:hypothetical protein JCM10213_002834 [Rhodosporidiobolus nylandii]